MDEVYDRKHLSPRSGGGEGLQVWEGISVVQGRLARVRLANINLFNVKNETQLVVSLLLKRLTLLFNIKS